MLILIFWNSSLQFLDEVYAHGSTFWDTADAYQDNVCVLFRPAFQDPPPADMLHNI